MKNRYLKNWLSAYLKQKVFSRSLTHVEMNGPRHILFLFVDHFELAGKEPRLLKWLTKYPELALKHTDADGFHPKHTWFYALDLIREDELEEMRNLVESGLGEVELHWHHSHDTEESFQRELYDGLTVFQKYGFMRPKNKKEPGSFAFIHGNWSLANSCGNRFCGVDNEVNLLKKAGCYADFTFPALHSKAQPAMINSIYYARNTGHAKSYNTGRLAKVGARGEDNELMIFEGPLAINWRDWHHKWHPTIENGEIGQSLTHDSGKRIDAWISQRIQVIGRPEWIFVKVFCHGGQDYTAVLGEKTDRMHTYLRQKYNDGKNYILHYVTAREAYNIVRAAEDGKTGNPNDYRDYFLPPPPEKINHQLKD